MKTPPLLLGTALLFWGWQTGFLIIGALMAVVLESARWIKARWEFSDDDFIRIWTFCSLLFLAAALYSFTSNEGPANFRSFFQDPNFATQRHASSSSARTAAGLIRSLPMVFFLFVAAQVFSSRDAIPLATISLILRRRWKKARKLGLPWTAGQTVNVSYPYLAVCLLAASIQSSETTIYFWGVCVLLAWGLWPHRPVRFGLAIWIAALSLAIALGYFGQGGLGRLRGYLETLNPQWLSSFTRRGSDPAQSRTQLGQIGRIKMSGKIVIRLEPKGSSAVPTLLREASYRDYKGQIWYAGNSKNDFENINHETNETSWVLSTKTNSAAVQIACYLDGGKGLLPLPEGSGRLDKLPVYILQKNRAGAVLAEGPGFVMFDALHGPGPTIDAAPNTNDDLYVYPKEDPALAQVISEFQLAGRSRQETLRTISGFFQGKFKYSTWQDSDRATSTNYTPLARFLLRTHSGHCEYFATATVLLLRKLGIPARYAVGYAVHEHSGRGYVVRQRDAHAWCLVWNEKKGLWQDFDTTPASWVEAEQKQASPFQGLSDFWSRIRFEISKIRWGQSRLRQYVLWAMGPILALLLWQIIFRSRRHRQRGGSKSTDLATDWPGLDSEFYQLERKLIERGLVRHNGEPLSSWLRRAVRDPALCELRDPLQQLLFLHYRYRFDPQGLSQAERDFLRQQAKACQAQMNTAIPRRLLEVQKTG